MAIQVFFNHNSILYEALYFITGALFFRRCSFFLSLFEKRTSKVAKNKKLSEKDQIFYLIIMLIITS